MKFYENIFKYGKDTYYERVFDTETKKSEYNKIQVKPYVYVPGNGNMTYFLDKNIKLIRKDFNSEDEYMAWTRSMSDMQSPYYGKTTPKYQYLKDNYYYDKDMNYVNNDHEMRTWYLDIEVSQEFGFPFPHEAKAQVTLIQWYDNFDEKYYVIGKEAIDGYKDLKQLDTIRENNIKNKFPENTIFINAGNEKDMFKYFFKFISTKNPAIWTAWNGELFDFPYLINRADKLGLNKNDFSPVQQVKYSHTKDGTMDSYKCSIAGIYLLDIMDLYKKFTFTPQTSFSLNNIASVELGSEKVQYGEYDNLDRLMESDYVTFVRYGIVDTQLIKEIDEKLNLINLVKSIAYKMGICLDDALGTVKPWGTYITNVAFAEGYVLPNDGGNRQDSDSIKGAWVADPVIGKHEWIVSFDWASLYPSIIRWCNFSPETWVPTDKLPAELQEIRKTYFVDDEDVLLRKVDEVIEKVTPLLEKYDYSAGINGSFYRRDEIGLIPRLIKQLYGERKSDKKEMFVHTQKIQDLKNSGATKEEIRKEEMLEAFWDTAQMTKKILLNSLYGALANKHFMLFNNDIAAAITANGRYTNKNMAFLVNDYLKTKLPTKNEYLIYGDTDSFYLTLNEFVKAKETKGALEFKEKIDFCDNVCEKIIQPFVNETTKKIGKSLNIVEEGPMAMDREIIADSGIFIAKKRYIARVLDVEGVRLKEPKKKIMGLEIVRSSTPAFCRKYLKESIDILLDGDEQHLQDWTTEIKKKFMSVDVEEISRVTGVNKVSFDFKVPNGKNSGGVKTYKELSQLYQNMSTKEIGFRAFNHQLYRLENA